MFYGEDIIMCDNFVHLHNHTEYSMLDGLPSPKVMIERAVELGQPGLAITDHGNLHGVIEFYRAAKEASIIPIIGFEGYMCRFGVTMHEKNTSTRENFHQLLLAETQEGYQNLIRLSSLASVEGFYTKPRFDFNVLEQYNKGLITTTGCMAAPIPRAIQSYIESGQQGEIDSLFQWYIDVFGKDRFYVELQEHVGIPELVKINKVLLDYTKKYDLSILPTNDAHYARPTDAVAHDLLLCVQTRAYVNQTQRMRFTDQEYYIKSRAEMEYSMLQYNIPLSSFDLTVEIMERCGSLELESKEKHHMPNIEITTGFSYDLELHKNANAGMETIFGLDWQSNLPEYKARLEHELAVIAKTGFSVYYLIISDICMFAKDNNILWNVRGSGAGSLVSYALGMSFVDPLKYGLLFERFLNEFRVSTPDFDMDFPDDMRETIINYLKGKYGEERVAQIITFGRMKARMCIRDVTRALGWEQHEIDALANKILNTPGKPITIKNSLDPTSEYYSATLAESYNDDENIRDALDIADQLEKTVRHSGIHAAAVAITDKDLIEYVPLMRPPAIASTKYVTQFDYPTLESLGLLKVDILGLATLSIIRTAATLIKDRHGVIIDYFTIPFDDKVLTDKAMTLLRSGEVTGVFQVESYGLRNTLMQLLPSTFQHIMDVISLYRPGPLEYIPAYIQGVNFNNRMALPHDDLADILDSTQGIIIYQEQIIKILQVMGGYTPGEADIIRKAISKKDVDKIEKERKKFIDNSGLMGYTADEAIRVFDDIERFALYGFNLAHAASYARITMLTAWLKSEYPVEFITACLITEWNKPEKVSGYILEARRMGIPVLPPDANKSQLGFSIDDNSGATIESYSRYNYNIPQGVAIRFGLESIKQVGKPSAESLTLLAGQINTVSDIMRLNFKNFNSRSLRRLIGAGVFDSLAPRELLIGNEERIIEHSTKAQDIYLRGQYSLFTPELKLKSTGEKFNLYDEEKESLGVWITKHPIEDHYQRLYDIVTHTILDLNSEYADDIDVATMVLVVDKVKDITSKSGKPMSFVTFSDIYGTIEAIMFPKVYAQFRDRLADDKIVVVATKVSHYRDQPSLIIDAVYESVQVVKHEEESDEEIITFAKVYHDSKPEIEQWIGDNKVNYDGNLLVRIFTKRGEPMGAIRSKGSGLGLEKLKQSKLRYSLE